MIAPVRAWLRYGLLNTVIVFVLAVVTWWLLADPEWSPLDIYPLPFNGYLFWAIIFVVFAGFNLEFAPFQRLRQPWRGIVITAATTVFSIVVTTVLARGLGHFYPDFSADRDGGLGYFTAALFVLFAFGTYVLTVVNWQHWPWPQLGLKQPLTGWCEIAFWFLPTLALFVVFGLPAVGTTATPGSALMSVDTVIGWFYCIIVAVVLTGSLLDNQPWSRLPSPAATAIGSTIGNTVIGTVLYFVLVPLVRFLLGQTNTDALGDTITQYPAQLGVCWVFSIVLWSNAFGNIGSLIVRTVVTASSAVGIFLLYFYVLAGSVLHEPPVTPGSSIHGNGLGFMNWIILMTLLYVVAAESWGLHKPVDAVTTPPTIETESESADKDLTTM
ncbi:hypothetical protein LQ424_29320 [Rhodococcus qingshengii]|uniref:hypothetical protein n=1 Tax=Rhodococcus qingshengii TaxID=334542 RepID=UPI001E351191|nr:hypothetical protein [Rhodococcus qingshengii]MCD2135927.1 hypothetical protein [Rhodococcus qingshengii]